jgi:hypothetical protein
MRNHNTFDKLDPLSGRADARLYLEKALLGIALCLNKLLLENLGAEMVRGGP